MRRTAIVSACVVAAIALGGCDVETNGVKVDGLNDGMNGRFEYEMVYSGVGEASFGKVVDTETGVTYLVVRCDYGKRTWGGVTPLLNSDGSPAIDGRYE